MFDTNFKFHVMFSWEDSTAEGYNTLEEAQSAARNFGEGVVLVLELKEVVINKLAVK